MRLPGFLEDLQGKWYTTSLHQLTRSYEVAEATVRYSTKYSFFKDEPNETLVFVRGDNLWVGELNVNDLRNSRLPRGLFIVRQPGYTQIRWYKNRKKQLCVQFKYSWRGRIKA